MMLFLQPCELKAAFQNDFGKQLEKRSEVDLCVSCSIHANLSPGSSLVRSSSSSAVFDWGGCGNFSLVLRHSKDLQRLFGGNPKSVMLF